jgi:nucleotide-binding universal stress UspA family protein
MGLFESILFPVDFSPSCVAMAPYVKRAAALFGAEVSLLHIVDLNSYNGFELYIRPPSEVSNEHRTVGREKLEAFLAREFPPAEYPRILAAGDAATQIAGVARDAPFDLIIMPTHAGSFRRMLLGSTTAKVLNDADCPVMTSRHAETIAPRPLEHREWLCAIDLSPDSERVLRIAKDAAAQVRSHLTLIHAIQAGDPHLRGQLDLEGPIHSAARQLTSQRIADLQRKVGSDFPVRIAFGSVKTALLEAARESDADALIIGRSPQLDSQGRLRDLTYTMVRDSPFPVLSV